LKLNHKLSLAVMAVLSTHGASAFAAPADEKASGLEIADIVVTAQRRSESIQNVPITIQALTSETLSQLNVTTFDDFAKYLPNVTTANLGPGQGNIYMRGLSVGTLGTQGSGSVGNFPNVAVYLDDQSTQLPGRNLDVYAADLERVEVLEGPQGTLFGAGAQAGVVRYITNKPKLNVTEGNVNASYGTTAHGDPNTAMDATINLPLIDDTLAVRAVIYDDHRGGYINNVASTFTRGLNNDYQANVKGFVYPTDSVVANNYALAGNAINPLSYQGMRLSALWKINDNWDALLQQTYQTMNAQGVFYQMPIGSEGQPLPPLSVTIFSPSHTRDRFESTSLTINGKIGELKAVYSGSYLVRNVDQVADYTNYARGVYGYYYQCAGYNGQGGGKCYSPVSQWTDTEKNIHQSHEFRLSTPDDWRLRGIFGAFWEKQQVDDDTEWQYRSVPNCNIAGGINTNCFLPVSTWPGANANNPGVRNSSTGFYDDFQREYTQKALFASADFDIIPKVLTFTAGTRYFQINNSERGGDMGSFYCKVFSTPTTYDGPCVNGPGRVPYGTNLNQQIPGNETSAKGFRSRANITWHVTPDALVYYTFSQGFRAGGFNRGSGQVLPDANGNPQYAKPFSYGSDDLNNNELGFKLNLLNHRVEFNGTVYKEDWKNVQVGFFCPACGLGNLTFGTNGPQYRVKGLELQVVARVTDGLTVTGAGSWNKSELINSPSLVGNIAGSPSLGQPITTWYSKDSSGAYTVPHVLQNLYGQPGSPLANSPPQQFNLRARYDWSAGDYKWFWQTGFQHQAHSYSGAGNGTPFEMPEYTTWDGSIGVSNGAWTIEAFGTNLTDVNKSLFTSSTQFIQTQSVMRPRVLGLKMGYRFSGK